MGEVVVTGGIGRAVMAALVALGIRSRPLAAALASPVLAVWHVNSRARYIQEAPGVER